jgi:hypothetical protein
VYDSGAYTSGEVDKAILAADKLIKLGMLLTPGHYHRAGAITSTAVLHAQILPAHFGPVEAVTFDITGGGRAGLQSAIQASLASIIQDNLNPSALKLLLPKYAIIDEKIYHNRAGLLAGDATAITVYADLATYSPSSSACSSPDEAEDAVFHGAMRSLQLKDGQHEGAAGDWHSMFMSDVKLLGISPQALAQAEGMAQTA